MHGERIGGNADEAATAKRERDRRRLEEAGRGVAASRKSPTARRLNRNREPVLRLHAVITKSGPARSGKSASVASPNRSR